jgi:hypothetical protein
LRASSRSGLFGGLVPALLLCLSLAGAGPATAGETKDDLLAQAKAAVSAASLPCSVIDARHARPVEVRSGSGRRGGRGGGGMGGGRNDAGGAPRAAFIEVACQEGLGYLIVEAPHARKAAASADAAPAPDFLNCLEAEEANARAQLPLRCELKPNADARPALQALAAHVDLPCQVQGARGLGHTENYGFFEVACARTPEQVAGHDDPTGYVLVTGRLFHTDRAATVLSCIEAQSNPRLKCELTHVDGVVDALRRYVSRTEKDCAPLTQRLVGPSPAGQVFEIVCANKAGYIAVRRQKTEFTGLTPCSDPRVAQECRLVADDKTPQDAPPAGG